jgi:hypothetical protein
VLTVTTTVASGFFALAPAAVVLDEKVTVTEGSVQVLAWPKAAQTIRFACVRAAAWVVVYVAAYSAASRVADSRLTQELYMRAKSTAAPNRPSISGRITANSAMDCPR